MQKEIIQKIISKGIIPTKELVNSIFENPNKMEELIQLHIKNLDTDTTKKINVDVKELKRNDNEKNNSNLNDIVRRVNIVKNFTEDITKKRDVQDFVNYYNDRFNSLKRILLSRQELTDAISISRVYTVKERTEVIFIGMVLEKAITKNKNLILKLEDSTGTISVLINRNKKNLYEKSRFIVEDEVIGINGVASGNIVFCNDFYFPDIPSHVPIKKCDDDINAIFISDMHVGSRLFLEEEFNKFIDWINGDVGDKAQRDIANKTKYIFFVGDLVDGIGIYPGQEAELAIWDIQKQYEKFVELVDRISKDKTLIICSGNHDADRLEEPQLGIFKWVAEKLYLLKNAIIVSNPAVVNIHKKENFKGFDVLLYHGFSFFHFIENVDALRELEGNEKWKAMMKFLIEKRHLAPSHGAARFVPSKKDFLVIDSVPDIFACGHVHQSVVSQYKNTTMICSSCFQSKTSLEEKLGVDPQPGRVAIVNLKNRDVKIMNFYSEETDSSKDKTVTEII